MPGTYLLPHDALGTDLSSRPRLSLGDREWSYAGLVGPPVHTWRMPIPESQLVRFLREASPSPWSFPLVSAFPSENSTQSFN